jgi:hypothetical protein
VHVRDGASLTLEEKAGQSPSARRIWHINLLIQMHLHPTVFAGIVEVVGKALDWSEKAAILALGFEEC